MSHLQFDTISMRANLAGTKMRATRLLRPQPVKHCTGLWYIPGRDEAIIPAPEPALRNQPWFFYPRTVHKPGTVCWVQEPHYRNQRTNQVLYAADLEGFNPKKQGFGLVRPARWMRRKWCRAQVTILETRAERLWEIDRNGIQREGYPHDSGFALSVRLARDWWRDRWNGLHGKDGPWEKNPWVVVYKYSFALL